MDIARALCKNLMYISFPREANNNQKMDDDKNVLSEAVSDQLLSRYCPFDKADKIEFT